MASNQQLGQGQFREASGQRNLIKQLQNKFRTAFRKFLEKHNRQQENVENFIPELRYDSDNENHFKCVKQLLTSIQNERTSEGDQNFSSEGFENLYSDFFQNLIKIYFDALTCAEQLNTSSGIKNCQKLFYTFLEDFVYNFPSVAILSKGKQERHWLAEISCNDNVFMALCKVEFQITVSDTKAITLLNELGKEPLSQRCIILLNQITELCFTSDVADGAKKYAFVAYNIRTRIDDANQAEQEAAKLLDFLHAEGFKITSLMDWKENDFFHKLREFLATAKTECSLAVVFIMAHGCEGKVFDVDDKPIELREIEDMINNAGIPKEIPRILVVQACRILQGPSQTGSSNNTEGCVDVLHSELSDPQKTPSASAPFPEESLDALLLESTEAGTVVQHETDGPKIKQMFENIYQKVSHKLNSTAQQTTDQQPKRSDNYVGFIKIMACSRGQEANRNTFIPSLINQLIKGFSICTAVDNTIWHRKRSKIRPEITRPANRDVYLTKKRVQSEK